MRYGIRVLTVACCAHSLWAVVSEVQAGPKEDCEQISNTELRISACSAVIGSDRGAVWAYINRGDAYHAIGQPDQAVRDLSEAIRLNPTEAETYRKRGNVYGGKAYFDSASYEPGIADITQAIRLRPDHGDYHLNRAWIYSWKGDYASALADYGRAIALRSGDELASAYIDRGRVYSYMEDYTRAIADYKYILKIRPAWGHSLLGAVFVDMGDYDRAIMEFTEAIKVEPNNSSAHWDRGNAYYYKGDYDRAISNHTESIKHHPTSYYGYAYRANAFRAKGDRARSIVDYDEVIRRLPDTGNIQVFADLRVMRGEAYHGKGDYERAIADYDQAISRESFVTVVFERPRHSLAYLRRGQSHEEKGDRHKAIEDYSKVLTFPTRTQQDRDRQAEATKRLSALQGAPPSKPSSVVATPSVAVPAASPQAPTASLGRRVALVIGNGNYRAVTKLPNPLNDAREMAGALRAAGFSDLIERYDLGVRDMQKALKAFEEKATGADWAVVYYAGHGIEVDGRNYLIPIDAELKSASDVEDETLPLDRVMARVAVAKKLQLVILDACRDNPFAPRMAQPTGVVRNVATRGLGRIEPSHPNLFVAYSARHGEVALDGTGKNSPYAKALVKHLAVPGVPLTNFFIRVRAEVLAETSGRQRPFEYGSLTDENLFFRPIAK